MTFKGIHAEGRRSDAVHVAGEGPDLAAIEIRARDGRGVVGRWPPSGLGAAAGRRINARMKHRGHSPYSRYQPSALT